MKLNELYKYYSRYYDKAAAAKYNLTKRSMIEEKLDFRSFKDTLISEGGLRPDGSTHKPKRAIQRLINSQTYLYSGNTAAKMKKTAEEFDVKLNKNFRDHVTKAFKKKLYDAMLTSNKYSSTAAISVE